MTIFACFIAGVFFGIFYLARNQWVYRVRTDILKADYDAYESLPEYDVMMRKFWVWDASRFLGMGADSSFGQPFLPDQPVTHSSAHYEEARALAALLPPPVDLDLVTARKIASAVSNSYYASQCLAHSYEKGQYDRSDSVQLALAALRKAREEGARP